MPQENDDFSYIEVGELFCNPSLGRRWHDTVRKFGGVAIYLIDDRLPVIQISSDLSEGEKIVKDVEISNYDTLRFTLRDTKAFQQFIAQRTADICIVELATD